MLAQEISDKDTLYKVIQDTIQKAIENALTSTNVQFLREQMYYLCHISFTVPTPLHEWAKQQVEDIYKSFRSFDETKPYLPSAQEDKPILTKDNLYHASLCCVAVSNCNANNYKNFFNNYKHNLKQVSMSRSKDRENVDRYIIAMQDGVVYMAFQSEPTVSRWIDSSYCSFSDGMLLLLVMYIAYNPVVSRIIKADEENSC